MDWHPGGRGRSCRARSPADLVGALEPRPGSGVERAGERARWPKGTVVGEAIQIGLGALVLIGFWWGLFALIRMFEPRPAPRPAVRHAGAPIATHRPPAIASKLRMTGSPVRNVPCCPDCVPGCQITGLAMGLVGGHGDDWWGQPFGDDGPNTEAMVFWGDECCPACGQCPICQGQGGA